MRDDDPVIGEPECVPVEQWFVDEVAGVEDLRQARAPYPPQLS